ncbi:MAG TPA: hypothetical protein VFP89_05540 [Propionibacteriaceae bacterium]|nr:hypothetical protein [Propionibacteriaceae bacterium]
MSRVPRGEGFSLLWRVGWRIEYMLLHLYGPATMDEDRDPKVEMRRERARRKALYEERKAARSR